MKKYLVVIGAAILLMALASPSPAQDWPKGFKSWGSMQIWSAMVNKPEFNTGQGIGLADTSPNQDLTRRNLYERFNLFLQYGDPKTVRAVIGFEADSAVWGEAANTNASATASSEGVYKSSTGATDTNYIANGGKMGTANTDQVALEIKHAFLDFIIPGTPAKLTVGLQPFAIGGRLFESTDFPGITLTMDFAPHKIFAYWYRANDRNIYRYNVNDLYALQYQYTEKLFNFYAYGAYRNDTYSGFASPESSTYHQYNDNPIWIGVGGGFRPGNWDFSGQLLYVGGKRDFVAVSDSDYSAWALEILGKYRIGPGLAVAGEIFYATGDDADNSDKINRMPRNGSAEAWSNFGLGRTVFYWMAFSDLGYQSNRQYSPTGMYYGRLNLEYAPLAWLNLNFNYLYIGDTTKGTPGAGTSAYTKLAVTAKTVNSPSGARTDKDADQVGQEINVFATLKIYEPLLYTIGFGYFFPGEVYNTTTKSAENAWSFCSRLVYAF